MPDQLVVFALKNSCAPLLMKCTLVLELAQEYLKLGIELLKITGAFVTVGAFINLFRTRLTINDVLTLATLLWVLIFGQECVAYTTLSHLYQSFGTG